MPEEIEKHEEIEEIEATEEAEAQEAGTNNVPTPEELDVIKAQLQEEQGARAALEGALAEKDGQIADLTARLTEAQETAAQFAAQLTAADEAHADAISHYRNVQQALNPLIPQGLIRGETVKDVDDSVGEALAIAEAVRESLAAEAQNNRVPAGAPTRTVNLEGLTPDELIRLGISQSQGGTS